MKSKKIIFNLLGGVILSTPIALVVSCSSSSSSSDITSPIFTCDQNQDIMETDYGYWWQNILIQKGPNVNSIEIKIKILSGTFSCDGKVAPILLVQVLILQYTKQINKAHHILYMMKSLLRMAKFNFKQQQ